VRRTIGSRPPSWLGIWPADFERPRRHRPRCDTSAATAKSPEAKPSAAAAPPAGNQPPRLAADVATRAPEAKQTAAVALPVGRPLSLAPDAHGHSAASPPSRSRMPAGTGTAAEASSGGGYAVAVASERNIEVAVLLPARCQNCGREREIVAMLGTSDDLVGLRTVDVPRRRLVLRQRDRVPGGARAPRARAGGGEQACDRGPAPAEGRLPVLPGAHPPIGAVDARCRNVDGSAAALGSGKSPYCRTSGLVGLRGATVDVGRFHACHPFKAERACAVHSRACRTWIGTPRTAAIGSDCRANRSSCPRRGGNGAPIVRDLRRRSDFLLRCSPGLRLPRCLFLIVLFFGLSWTFWTGHLRDRGFLFALVLPSAFFLLPSALQNRCAR
jgi:hypothetical protein